MLHADGSLRLVSVSLVLSVYAEHQSLIRFTSTCSALLHELTAGIVYWMPIGVLQLATCSV